MKLSENVRTILEKRYLLSAKTEVISRAFPLACEKGCKDIAIFRYDSNKKGTLIRFADAN